MKIELEKLFIDSLSGLSTLGYTDGSVLFIKSGTVAEDNANFFWDDTNNRLGIGTAIPTTLLDVNGVITATGLLNNSTNWLIAYTHSQDDTTDVHTQYALLAGRSGGQTLIGGTVTGETLSLVSNALYDSYVAAGLVGPELIQNGGFGSGSNWTATGGWTISGGQATWSSTSGSGDLTNTMVSNPVAGEYYLVKITLVSSTSAGLSSTLQAFLGTDYTFPNEPFGWHPEQTANTYSVLVQAINTNPFKIICTSGGAGENFVIDNISVRKITKNLSFFVPNNLGIGTVNPQAPIHIFNKGSGTALLLEGTDQISPKLTFKSGGLNGGGESSLSFDSGNSWYLLTSAAFRFDSGYGIQWAAANGPLLRADTTNNLIGVYLVSNSRLQLGGRGTVDLYRYDGTNFGDGMRLRLGESQDAEMYYNADDLVINPKAVGTGKIITAGDLTLGDGASLGSELVTNGTFAADTDWTKGDANWRIASGVAERYQAGTTHLSLSQSISGLTVGKVYALTFTLNLTAGGNIITTFGNFKRYHATTDNLNNTAQTFYVRATATSMTLDFDPTTTSVRCTIDNVSVKEMADGDLTVGDITASGDQIFTGAGSGLPYGSCWGNEIAWTQANAAQNTWYEISIAAMADGQLNLVTHDSSGKLTVLKAGKYLCNYSASFETSGGSYHVQATFSVSGTETNDGMNHFETLGSNKQSTISGTAILDLAANATVEVSVRTTDAGTPNISCDHLNITVVMIGG